ncbi:hypothetical protein BVRB_018470 [Beta vulgaris subsp. vulgaris]|uniref:Uncharacterized protein n=1 Tax=Beta vulgaris subsp. vulgaris TaxID=3555 RepID=A0A0J7YLT0_BETVV|nr:hypothetical protein BVRB_018470 [Beta vulgaris subsp. vulgaris]
MISCGTTSEYRQNALCPPEQRDDPETITYGFSPDDRVIPPLAKRDYL